MDPTELLRGLVESGIASTGAVLLVLALRRRLRAHFGATIAYGAWALVPLAALAVLVPAAPVSALAVPMLGEMSASLGSATVVADRVGAGMWLVCAWMAGVMASVLCLAGRQRRFVRGLGAMRRDGEDVVRAEAIGGLPAVIGLWRPVVALPADFEARYSAQERTLMLAHERAHIRHGDLHATAVAVALRCIFWFNPLLHPAARCFGHDQELACDARVIARHPHARRVYGEAMLKTQLAAHSLPLGCHWGHSHPLTERIAMLKQPVPSLSRRRAGVALVSLLACSVAAAASAVGPATPAATASSMPVSAVDTPAPVYPEGAKAGHVGGRVELLIDLDANGRPLRVVVDHAEPPGVFDQATIDAAMQWKFNPRIEDGRAVASSIRVPVTFVPDGAAH